MTTSCQLHLTNYILPITLAYEVTDYLITDYL